MSRHSTGTHSTRAHNVSRRGLEDSTATHSELMMVREMVRGKDGRP